MFNFWSTQTQNLSVKEDFSKMPEWDKMVRQEICAWRDFHRYWIKEGCHFIRFEDLTQKTAKTLTDVFYYLMDTDDLDDTEIEAQIKRLTKGKAPELYKPRSSKSNRALFTPEMLKWIKDTL